jgi:hypothetical protein
MYHDEAEDSWNKLQTPELPEGYRVQEDGKSLQQSIHGKWHQLAYRNPDDTISCFSRDMEPNELIAIAAFVQGAR